jgi:hypothetical protein
VCRKRKTGAKKREREDEMGERPIPLSNICFGIIHNKNGIQHVKE